MENIYNMNLFANAFKQHMDFTCVCIHNIILTYVDVSSISSSCLQTAILNFHFHFAVMMVFIVLFVVCFSVKLLVTLLKKETINKDDYMAGYHNVEMMISNLHQVFNQV